MKTKIYALTYTINEFDQDPFGKYLFAVFLSRKPTVEKLVSLGIDRETSVRLREKGKAKENPASYYEYYLTEIESGVDVDKEKE